MVLADKNSTVPGKSRSWFWRLALLFSAIYFFSQNGLGALPNLPLQFLLKNTLKLDPSQLAYFQAVTLIAWVIKPLWGFISDSFPLFGTRRKSYLMLSSLLAAASWLALAWAHENYWTVLIVISVCYLAYAFQDVVTDGLMIETGKPYDLTGKFQAIQWSAVYAAMVIAAFCGGAIADLIQHGKLSYRVVFAGTALFPAMTAALVFFCAPKEVPRVTSEAGSELKDLFRHKSIWILALFLFFWNFSPSFGAPFFYYSVDTLKFSGIFLGALQGAASAAGLLGSILYGKYIERISMRRFLIFAVFFGIGAILFNYIFFIPFVIQNGMLLKGLALGSNFIFGMLGTWIFLTLLNLAAKVSPQFAGGTAFALLMSFYNLGLMGSSALGGLVFPVTGLKPLILISALFSLFVLFFMPFLPIPEPLTGLESRIQAFLQKIASFSRKVRLK